MIKSILLASVAIVGLTAPSFGADFKCKPYEKFSKKSEADQTRLMEKSIGVASTNWTTAQLDALSEQLLHCAEKRNKKIQERNAFDSLLGAVGGAITSKEGQTVEGALSGAAATSALFANTKNKKLLSLQAALKRTDERRYVLAAEGVSPPMPSKAAGQSAVPGLTPLQVRLARQAVRDGDEQAAYQSCSGDRDCRNRIANEMRAERKRWLEQGAEENRKKEEAKQAQKFAAQQKRADKEADIEKRTPVYVQNAIKQNADKLVAAGFDEEALASIYGGVSLRAYLSVMLTDASVRIFKENSFAADLVVVVKPTSKKSSKYYFDFDYGDLTPKAIELPITSGLKLVPLLPEKEVSFAALYFVPYRETIEAGLGY